MKHIATEQVIDAAIEYAHRRARVADVHTKAHRVDDSVRLFDELLHAESALLRLVNVYERQHQAAQISTPASPAIQR